ncbi:aquaporin SIP1-1-like [Mercurialis annua]|uniref:aquaporin SIP1-1-like n=1 Tax=Mercurialis annua TaxID=3986 RepID=UPI00215FD569|nr:aquaporin SIP1-1-like [Mercurialis annua]
MGAIKSAIGDAILTSMWVFSLPFLGISSSIIATYFQIEPKSTLSLLITINLATLLYLIFSLMGAALGGASFNPATTLTVHAAGVKPDSSLLSMAVRFPAQAAGGVGGALAILELMPEKYKHVLKGPSLKADLHTGAVAEGVLSFVVCFCFLVIMFKGPKNFLVKLWLLACVITGLVITGGKYTGPAMNPANAYGWAFVNNWHNSWELFYVYWIGPFIGAVLSAWVYRFLFKPAAVSTKKKQA